MKFLKRTLDGRTRRIRVLHIIDSLDLGGAQETLENLVRFGNHGRFSFDVASMHRHGIYSSRISRHGARTHSLSPHKLLPLYVPKLIGLLAVGRFDIVHCHLTWANLIAKPISRLMGVRAVFNHDQTNEQFRHRGGIRFHLDKLTNRLSTHLFAVSESIRRFLISAEGIPPEKVSLVYNGIDLDRFPFRSGRDEATREEIGILPDQFLVAGIGRLHPQKNFSLFLRVAAATIKQDPSFRFLIAGDGALRRVLEAESKAMHLDKYVRFCGFVPDTARFFPSLDALMMTSDYEGLPLTLLEAMASGVPTLCSAVDGIKEIIEDGKHGLLSTPGEISGFVTGLLRLKSNAEERSRLAKNARSLVETRFSAELMTRSVEEIYERTLKRIWGGVLGR